MKIDLYLNRADLETVEINKNQTALIIDVLRASTTIITAINNGCRAVIPVIEVEEAFELARQFPRQDVLLAGERNEMFIKGFDLSNSPLEFTQETVRNKMLIFTSTNGAKLFRFSASAKQTLIFSFVNVSSTVEFIMNNSTDVAILCAGKHGQFGLEDAVCGGMLISKLTHVLKKAAELNDGAVAAFRLYQHYAENILDMMRQSSHGRRLVEIGQDKDLIYAAAVDAIPIVPIVRNGRIIAPDGQSYN